MMMRLAASTCLALSLVSPSVARACLLAGEAQQHIGEDACVCGIVASSHYATKTRRQPTFLNLGKPYQDQIFTAVIWGDDRPKFGEPERAFEGKSICVTGRIEIYKDKPEIIVHEPDQLKEQKQ